MIFVSCKPKSGGGSSSSGGGAASAPSPPSPVNCAMSVWSDWGSCTSGSKSRTRTITTAAANGGASCGVTTESTTCVAITSISPNYFHNNGLVPITVNGSFFESGNSIKIGNHDCIDIVRINSEKITCKVPTKTNHTEISQVDVTLLKDNIEKAKLTNGFTYIGKPSLWLDSSSEHALEISSGQISKWKSIPWIMTNGLSLANFNDEPGFSFLAGINKIKPLAMRELNFKKGVEFKLGNSNDASFLLGPLLSTLLTDKNNFTVFIIFKPSKIDYSFQTDAPIIIGTENKKFGLSLHHNKMFLFFNRGDTDTIDHTDGISITLNEKVLATFGMFGSKLKLAKNGGASQETIATLGMDLTQKFAMGKGKVSENFKGHIYEILIFKESFTYPNLRTIDSLLKQKWEIP